MGISENKKIGEFVSNAEAMIDFYEHALKGGTCAFRSANKVMDMLTAACRESLYNALEESEIQTAEIRHLQQRNLA